MQKKDDKEGNKTADKQEKQRKNRAREKDRNRFAKKGPNYGFSACVKNKFLSCLIKSDYSKNMPFFLQNFLAIFMLIS